LHLVIAVLATTLDPSETSKPIPAINIAVPSPFDSLETFIEEAATKYNLDLFHVRPSSDHPGVESISTPDSLKDASDYVKSVTLKRTTAGSARGAEGMKQALQVYKERYPHITGIFIGTRRTDPHGGEFSVRSLVV
jgi:FAD synthetase